MLLHLWAAREDLLTVFSFAGEEMDAAIPVSTGAWRLLVDSADPQWNGPARKDFAQYIFRGQ